MNTESIEIKEPDALPTYKECGHPVLVWNLDGDITNVDPAFYLHQCWFCNHHGGNEAAKAIIGPE